MYDDFRPIWSRQYGTIAIASFAYSAVCASGPGATAIVLLFIATSFFAFLHMVFNGPPRSWTSVLIALVPLIGGLYALGKMLTRAFSHVLPGLLFYIFPLVISAAPLGKRMVLSGIAGCLFFCVFSFVPGVRENPRASFIFMWALPTSFFFIACALVLPFIGHFADVNSVSHSPHGHGDDGFTSGHDHQLSHHQVQMSDHPGTVHLTHDHHVVHDHPGIANRFHDGGYFVNNHHLIGHSQPLSSYPQQGQVHATWFDSRFDPTTGHITINGTHGHFELSPSADGGFMGQNSVGAQIHISHDPHGHTLTVTGPHGIRILNRDGANGEWRDWIGGKLTTVREDPLTNSLHIHGPDSEMTIKFNPLNNSAHGTGTERR